MSTKFKLFILTCIFFIILASAGYLLYAASHAPNTHAVPLPPAPAHPFGVNVALEQWDAVRQRRALQLVEDAGFHWVRQRFPWAEMEPAPKQFDWAQWDEIVDRVAEYDLALVAVLDGSPAWAREAIDGDNDLAPPRDSTDFARFTAAFAQRYGDKIDYYQIWDAPNIYPHWGERDADGAGYSGMLCQANIYIKRVDPTATILMAGLASTVETRGRNLSEPQFLHKMYDAGGGACFDIAAVKPYGFWSGPEDRRVDIGVLNFSRLELARAAMVERGDATKPLWAVEMGWNSLPTDWSGEPPPWGTDDEAIQRQRTIAALKRAHEETPWLSAMLISHLRPNVAAKDPASGFALLDETLEPRPLYYDLQRHISQFEPIGAGQYLPNHPTARYEGDWRVTWWGADVGKSGDSLSIPFRGTQLDLTVRRGSFWALFYITVDGQPANALPRDEQGRAYMILYDPLAQTKSIPIARGLSDDVHEARLVAEGGWSHWVIGGWRVSDNRHSRWRKWQYGIAAVLIIGAGLLTWQMGKLANGQMDKFTNRQMGKSASPQVGISERGTLFIFAAMVAVLIFGHLSPFTILNTLAALLLFGLILWRLDLGLALTTFAIPFFLFSFRAFPKAVSYTELLIAMCCVSWLTRHIITSHAPRFTPHVSRFTSLDYAVIAFIILSTLSLTVSELWGVSMREWRVIVMEGALFYFLIRNSGLSEDTLLRLVDALVLAGLAAALIGLYQYFISGDVIVAEGVRRIRGVYGSPNNLGLFLGRVVPFIAGMLVIDSGKRRRIGYAVAAAPIVLCLYWTYSRGAWLLGVPAALLFIGIVRRGKTLWAMVGSIVAGIMSLQPAAGTERVRSLFDTTGGTTYLRLKLWRATVNMIKEHPLFGVGLDNFLYQYRTRYVLPSAYFELNLSHPHNIILDFWSRLGIWGAFIIIWLLTAFFRAGLRAYYRLSDSPARALVLGALASMVDFLAHGLIDHSFFLVDLSFVFFLSLGIIGFTQVRCIFYRRVHRERRVFDITFVV